MVKQAKKNLALIISLYISLSVSLSFSILHATTVTLEISDTEKAQDAQNNTINTANVGDTITVTVVVSGGDRDTGNVTVQGLDALHVLGQSQSTSIQVVNNNYTSEKTYTYNVALEHAGTFKLGPAQVTLSGGSKAQSNEIILQIIDDPSHRTQNQTQQTQTMSNQSPTQNRTLTQNNAQRANQDQANAEATIKPEVLCSMHTSEQNIVVGQPIELFVTIHARGPIRELGLSPPSFPGFTVKEIEKFTQKTEILNGKNYDVREKKYILTALEPGTKEIPAIHIDYLYEKARKQKKRHEAFFDNFLSGFFDGPQLEKRSITSKPLSITINALPIRDNLDNNLNNNVDGVGQFKSFTATVDKPKATVNEAILFKLEIEGKGNLDQIPDLRLTLPEFVKFYKSKTSMQENPDYSSSKKTFEYIVQVGQAGTIEIPAQEFTYFDAIKKEYITLKTTPITLVITPGQNLGSSIPKPKVSQKPSVQNNQEQETQKQERDINFIEEETEINKKNSPELSLWLFLLLLLIPVIFLNGPIITRIKKYIQTSWLKKHSYKKKLTDFQTLLESFIQNNNTAKLYNFFLMFFATKFHQDTAVITEQYIERKLQELEWQPDKIAGFLDFLNECASITFIAHHRSIDEKQALLKKAQYWFLILNK